MILSVAASAPVRAAAIDVESEPNGTKLEATPIACLVPGGRFEGVTTGAGTLPLDPTLDSADTYRVGVCALSPGVWRHRLVLTTGGPDEHVISIRGLSVIGPPIAPVVVPGSDVPLQVSIGGSGQPNYVQWYGFGRAEEIYVRVTGTANTTSPYVVELVSELVSVTALPGAFRAGTIQVSTVGQGHNTDTEIFVLDADRAAIPGYRNDDEPGGATNQSRLARAYAPGVHHLAIARFNVADDRLSGFDDAYALAPVLDSGDHLVSWSPSGSSNVSFAITDAIGTTSYAAALAPEPYSIAWYRFTVVDPPPPIAAACPGDGTGTACPCGNSGGAGRGCANSVNAAGALLEGSGIASVSSDGFVLVGSAMPVSSALYFQGTALVAGGAGSVFGDGLRCAGGAVVRLETRTNFGGGSQYPSAGDPPISVRGSIPPQGGERAYQVWYRNSDPTFCTSAFYNLTNAVLATWVP